MRNRLFKLPLFILFRKLSLIVDLLFLAYIALWLALPIIFLYLLWISSILLRFKEWQNKEERVLITPYYSSRKANGNKLCYFLTVAKQTLTIKIICCTDPYLLKDNIHNFFKSGWKNYMFSFMFICLTKTPLWLVKAFLFLIKEIWKSKDCNISILDILGKYFFQPEIKILLLYEKKGWIKSFITT